LALLNGQVTPLVLFGLAGFVACEFAGYELLAGALLAFVAFKPNLALLLWPALALGLFFGWRWRLAIGATLSISALCGLALIVDPRAFGQYADMIRAGSMARFYSPTLGTVLRAYVGWDKFSLQYVAPVLGLAWFCLRWRREEAANWPKRLPELVGASLLFAPYGVWLFDLLVLLPAVLWAAGRPTKLSIAAYFLLNLITQMVWAFAVDRGHEFFILGFAVNVGWIVALALALRTPNGHRGQALPNPAEEGNETGPQLVFPCGVKKVVSGRPASAWGKAQARTGPPDTAFFISAPVPPE
jgi:hypothetical protein